MHIIIICQLHYMWVRRTNTCICDLCGSNLELTHVSLRRTKLFRSGVSGSATSSGISPVSNGQRRRSGSGAGSGGAILSKKTLTEVRIAEYCFQRPLLYVISSLMQAHETRLGQSTAPVLCTCGVGLRKCLMHFFVCRSSVLSSCAERVPSPSSSSRN